MSFPMVAIGDVVEAVKSWNPLSLPTPKPIRYIDLSAVDKDEKRIVAELVVEVLSSEAPSRARQLVEVNDILVSTVRPNLNGVAMVNNGFDGATASTGYCVLRPAKKKLDPTYLHYWVLSPAFVDEMPRLATGASYPAVSDAIIKNSKIPLPPLPTQRRIAAILDKAQALVANDRRTLAVYDQLAKSLFLEMFGDPVRNERGWVVVEMDEVASKITDGEHATPKRSERGFLLLSARNVQNRSIDISNGVDHVEQDEFNRIYRRCNPEQGDILISCSGSIGRVTMVRTTEPFVLVRSVALIKPKPEKVESNYLEQYLLTEYMQAIMKNSAKSSSQANLFSGPIKALPMMLPPMKMQLRWKKAVESIDAQRDAVEASLLRSEGLFGSLLQGAFKGESWK